VVDLVEEMGQIEYALSQKGEDTRDTTSRVTGEEDSSGNIKNKSQSKHMHRKSATGLGQIGLASIGSQLLKSGTITDECLELDEDDRLMDLFSAIDDAKAEIRLITKAELPKEQPHPTTGNETARVVFNLSDFKSTPIDDYGSLDLWLAEMKKSCLNFK
jgi:hypothetical protein